MKAEEAYALSRKYTEDTIEGAGAVAGKPCQIQSITDITGGHRVTFLWVDNSDVSHTSVMDVMDGAKGDKGDSGDAGLGIKSVVVNAEDHLIITYDDDTTQDAGQIQVMAAVDSVNGKTGDVVLGASDVGALPDDTDIPSKTSDLTNDSIVDSASYDSANHQILFKNGTTTLFSLDATAFVKDGMVDTVTITGGNLVITFNTDAGKQDISIPITDIFNPANYYDKDDVDGLLADKVSKSNTAGLLKNDGTVDTTTYATKASVDAIKDGQSIDSFADVETALGGKADKVTSAVSGNFAGLDANGNLTDSGSKASDFASSAIMDGATINSFGDVETALAGKANATDVASDIRDVYSVMGKNGAKNLITIQRAGYTGSYNGISYVFNNDGSVTLNGTATANAYIYLWASNTWANEKFKAGSYIASASLDKASETKVWFGADKRDASSYIVQYFNIGVDSTTPVERTFESDGEYYISYWVNVRNGDTVDNVTIYPMLRLAEDTDDTYQPYAPTNAKLNEEKMSYADNGVLGAKNLLPYPYKNTTTTINGITFTDNGDGTITANGTATELALFRFKTRADANFTLNKARYIYTGCPAGGSTSTYLIDIGSTTGGFDLQDVGNGVVVVPTADNCATGAAIRIFRGTTVNNLIFKPMLRLAEDTDNTYQPYAMTNRGLTEKVNVLPREVFVTTDTRTTTTNDANTLPCGFTRMSDANSNLPTDGTGGNVWYDILTVRQSNDSSKETWGYGFQLAVQTTTNANMGDMYVRAVNGGATPTWGAWRKLN